LLAMLPAFFCLKIAGSLRTGVFIAELKYMTQGAE